MPNLNFNNFRIALFKAVEKREPFSHIRLGDGEGIILGFPQYTSIGKLDGRLDKWFGSQYMNVKQKIKFSSDLLSSVKNSDIVGIPCLRHHKVNQDWRNVEIYLNKFGVNSKNTNLCCMDCIVDFQRKNLFHELFKDIETINCITCRNVIEGMQNRFHFKNVNMFYLKPQNKPSRGNHHTNKKHFPDRYNDLKLWLQTIKTCGEIFLVGAGGLGKVYCNWIKKAGGVAIDIGSVFDGWAGINTRSYLAHDLRTFTL